MGTNGQRCCRWWADTMREGPCCAIEGFVVVVWGSGHSPQRGRNITWVRQHWSRHKEENQQQKNMELYSPPTPVTFTYSLFTHFPIKQIEMSLSLICLNFQSLNRHFVTSLIACVFLPDFFYFKLTLLVEHTSHGAQRWRTYLTHTWVGEWEPWSHGVLRMDKNKSVITVK